MVELGEQHTLFPLLPNSSPLSHLNMRIDNEVQHSQNCCCTTRAKDRGRKEQRRSSVTGGRKETAERERERKRWKRHHCDSSIASAHSVNPGSLSLSFSHFLSCFPFTTLSDTSASTHAVLCFSSTSSSSSPLSLALSCSLSFHFALFIHSRSHECVASSCLSCALTQQPKYKHKHSSLCLSRSSVAAWSAAAQLAFLSFHNFVILPAKTGFPLSF